MKVDCCRLEYAPIQSQNQLSFPTCEPWAWMPWPSKSKQALAEIQSFQFKPSGLKQTFNCHFPGSLLKCNLKIRPKPLSITTRREDQALHHANRHFSMWSGQLAVYPQYAVVALAVGFPQARNLTTQRNKTRLTRLFAVLPCIVSSPGSRKLYLTCSFQSPSAQDYRNLQTAVFLLQVYLCYACNTL